MSEKVPNTELEKLNLFQLRDYARECNVYSSNLLTKEDFINALSGNEVKLKNGPKIEKPQFMVPNLDISSDKEDSLVEIEGVLDIMTDGYGFLRTKNYEIATDSSDVHVNNKLIRGLGLRRGDFVKCKAKQPGANKSISATEILEVNGHGIDNLKSRVQFENLVPIFPDERFVLESEKTSKDFAIRCIDLIAPIGKGQRAMIVSPPKAGKTTLLKKVANAITKKYADVKLIVLLIDERPEEVTDMQRSIDGEVVYSTFDETPEHHTKIAELVIERAKRLVEEGQDVVIIMDSLTRLARAYNLTVQPSGRTLSGGIDPASLHLPKRFFGAARNIEKGGSLTIIATALVDTGSRMDDVIYEEFKGTGNLEIHLDRKLSEKRIFPAIDLNRSGTRREDLLLTDKELKATFAIRRILSSGDTQEATESLIDAMIKTKNNDEFIDSINAKAEKMAKEGYSL